MCAILRNQGTPFFIRAGLLFSLGLALCALFLYALGIDFTDKTLFLLLGALRCLSLLVCLFALTALGFAIRNIIRRPGLRYTLSAALYLGIAALGAALIAANSFIVAVAGGNG
jgi:hypothetical protein